ncbi:MAG: hypothetical protein K2P81_13685 [Bacteriovoracaceae bacterium]|nr:hypothetical protein [Bacteriovoracaceae bacterium]
MKWLLLLFFISCGQSNNSNSLTEQSQGEPLPEPSPVLCREGSLPQSLIRDVDYLSFPNFGYRGVGRCRGHALLSQKLLLLMRFDPTLQWNCSEENCRELVREYLERIENDEVVIVPGFKSLAAFSAEPVVQFVMKSHIISYGTRYYASPVPLPNDRPRSLSVFQEALRRVRSHHVPYIALNGAQVGDHGVLAYKISNQKGFKVLCVRDPNIIPDFEERCQNYMFVSDQKIRYVRFDRPEDNVELELTDDEDKRVKSYRQVLCR